MTEGGGPRRTGMDAHMGERHDGGGPSPRRHVEELLGAALREHGVDAAAERRAAEAFRSARDAGAPRTRRRDDWRPRERAHVLRSARATVLMLLASLTLGGVAVAAIGAAGSSGGASADRPRPDAPAGTPDRTAGRTRSAAPAAPSSGPASTEHPATAKDTLAHCRAYEQVTDHGKALDATAWQRLVAAAGGEANVASYCAGRIAAATDDGKDPVAKGATKAAKKPGTGRSTEKTGRTGGKAGAKK
ncbi:hypothetical protein ABZ915_27340 [Streptomyces sp. NPDC046915]|uniref:hypothetical protein n=1 Tax=Streptomyces sp. NPDC046915 TaxID=3155257 RepID=UPI0033CCE3CC